MKNSKQRYLVVAALTMGCVTTLAAAGTAGQGAEADSAFLEKVREAEIEVAAISERAAFLDRIDDVPHAVNLATHEFEWADIQRRINDLGNIVSSLKETVEAEGWRSEIVAELESLTKAMEVQAEKGFQIVADVREAVQLQSRPLYEVRLNGVAHYADHIDSLLESAENRARSDS